MVAVIETTQLPVQEETITVEVAPEGLDLKPIKLEDVGFLRSESTLINCPACKALAMSVVHEEVVTTTQRLFGWTKCGMSWCGRHDINHYCSKCGCFIGRFRPLDRLELCKEQYARTKATNGTMTLKIPREDCGVMAAGWRKKWQADRARKKAEREAEAATAAAAEPTTKQVAKS